MFNDPLVVGMAATMGRASGSSISDKGFPLSFGDRNCEPGSREDEGVWENQDWFTVVSKRGHIDC